MENNISGSISCEFDLDLYETWSSRSSWSDRELSEYACEYGSFKQFQRGLNYFKWVLYTVGGLIGISSSILALWTFSHREFSAVSFMYHRLINAIELLFMGLMLERAARDYLSPQFLYSPSWATYFSKISGKIDNTLPTWVNIITLFISVERAVACLAPTHFSRINRVWVVWTVMAGAFCISLSIWAPSSFAHTTMFDNRTDPARYMPVWTEWAKSSGYRCYHLIRHALTSLGAVLMVLASITAVIGLQRTAARGLRRYSSSSRILLATCGGPTNRMADYWCLLRQLSYLQLCETVPMVILHILLVAADSIHWDYKGGGAMAPWETSFPVAIKTLSLARTKQTTLVFLDISNVAAHCFHFYWYLIFCPKVRRGFVNSLRQCASRRRSNLVPIERNGSMDGQHALDPQSIILQQSVLSMNGNTSVKKTRKSLTSNGHVGVTFL